MHRKDYFKPSQSTKCAEGTLGYGRNPRAVRWGVAWQSLGDMLGEDLLIGWSFLTRRSGVDTDVLGGSFIEQVNIKLHVYPLPPTTTVHVPCFSSLSLVSSLTFTEK